MWQYAETARAFQESQAPEWVEDWLSRRRGPKKGGRAQDDKAKPKVSVSAAKMAVHEKPEDPKVLERKKAQVEKRKAERVSSILARLEELESWLSDQLSSGPSGFSSMARERCRLAGQRLVDAKAPGLAGWVDELPSRYFNMKEELRPDFLIKEFGKLYLLIEAYRKQDSLPVELCEDVRRIAGWSLKPEEFIKSVASDEALVFDSLVASVLMHRNFDLMDLLFAKTGYNPFSVSGNWNNTKWEDVLEKYSPDEQRIILDKITDVNKPFFLQQFGFFAEETFDLFGPLSVEMFRKVKGGKACKEISEWAARNDIALVRW